MFCPWSSGKSDIMFKLNPTAIRFLKLRTEMSDRKKVLPSWLLCSKLKMIQEKDCVCMCVCVFPQTIWQLLALGTGNYNMIEQLGNVDYIWDLGSLWVVLRFSWNMYRSKRDTEVSLFLFWWMLLHNFFFLSDFYSAMVKIFTSRLESFSGKRSFRFQNIKFVSQ